MNEPHWRVVVDDRARKDLRRLDPPTRKRILSAIARLLGDDWTLRLGPLTHSAAWTAIEAFLGPPGPLVT